MLVISAPFALYFLDRLAVLNTASAVHAVVHVGRIEPHEVATQWTDCEQCAVKLQYIAQQGNLLECGLYASFVLF